MAIIIGKANSVPEQKFLPEIERLAENEVIVFLRDDPQYYTATNMVLSMMATYIGRYGAPVMASNLHKVFNIGIFVAWDTGRKISELCDEGYFSRQHCDLEEYFIPEEKFFEFIKNTKFEKRPIVKSV